MRLPLLAAFAALSLLQSCFQLSLSGHVGYANLKADGDVGYVSGSNNANIQQDVESAFGLGDTQGSPYARIALDTGVQVFSVSGFMFEDSGTGTLEANFGDSPVLIAGAPVESRLEMTNIKGAYALQISLGPIAVSPGIAVDYFDLDLQVRDLIGIASEDVELQAPVPLAFLRGEVDLGVVSAIAEVGYMQVSAEDVDGSLLDVEALLQVHPTPMLSLFAGYRAMTLDADGEINGDAFDADITIGGFMLGGGLRF